MEKRRQKIKSTMVVSTPGVLLLAMRCGIAADVVVVPHSRGAIDILADVMVVPHSGGAREGSRAHRIIMSGGYEHGPR